ncbi:MAG: DUF6134 family protein [Chromatiales bacterium]|jgi:hypothetical protein
MASGLGLAGLMSPGAARSAIVMGEASAGGVKTYRYRILWRDSKIGYHRVRISRDPDGLTVIEHEREMLVKLLFLTVYQFRQRSRELWVGGTLTGFRSESIENGEDALVLGHSSGNHMVIDGPEGEIVAPADIATTESFWTASALDKPYLVDTVKGIIVEPEVYRLDDGRWHLEHESISADIRFDDGLMHTADVDSDGNLVRFVPESQPIAGLDPERFRMMPD